MHNMALALHEKGFMVSGSDDEINEPSRGRLQKAGLLPAAVGWFPEKLDSGIDAVILGMHARADNPELIRAKELGLKIYSYPEYIYEATRDKTRIVIGGSHGKTTITAMILHVMQACEVETDYLVGAQLQGFTTMVRLSNTARFAVIEGDEYLASPIDRRPKFHLYHPHIAVISGIAWDHINVFPTFDLYKEQFATFIRLIEPGGFLAYCGEDKVLTELVRSGEENTVKKVAYGIPAHAIRDGITYLLTTAGDVPLNVFGEHNLMNLEAARLVCAQVGIGSKQFYGAIRSFTGAAKRLELVHRQGSFSLYKDFAHSPSKLKATIAAVKAQFGQRKVVACMELHTFSSLTAEFLEHYRGAMDDADEAIVYFNPHTIAHKKLQAISVEQVQNAFARPDIKVMIDSHQLIDYLTSHSWSNSVLLMMSSGNFDGVDFKQLATELNLP